MTLDPRQIIEALALTPHPEGGFYAETFRSQLGVESAAHGGLRSASTAIYFLLRAGDFSALHRVRSDEVWHYYAGDALELVLLHADGRAEVVQLGSALLSGERPQHVVPADVFQGARPVAAGRHGYTLCGCTVAPGFEFRDFELPSRSELLARFPGQERWVRELTR